jgi:hypothetical protein
VDNGESGTNFGNFGVDGENQSLNDMNYGKYG